MPAPATREPLWVVATTQTAGRGRRGRAWVSPPGNLYASLLLVDPAPAAVAPQLAFVAGLAVHDACAALAPGVADALRLKWPNDLLCGGAKIAGILIEGEAVADAIGAVIGIGVNCRHHPDAVEHPATDFAAQGSPDRSPRAPRRAAADHGGTARRMGPRGGLCRDPQRLARPGRRSRPGDARAVARS